MLIAIKKPHLCYPLFGWHKRCGFGIAHATIPDGNGVIHACYLNSDGRLRVVNDPASCKRDETALSWSQTGPQGPQGPVGPSGPQGPQGAPGTSEQPRV
jgi:hypothetical protein